MSRHTPADRPKPLDAMTLVNRYRLTHPAAAVTVPAQQLPRLVVWASDRAVPIGIAEVAP